MAQPGSGITGSQISRIKVQKDIDLAGLVCNIVVLAFVRFSFNIKGPSFVTDRHENVKAILVPAGLATSGVVARAVNST